MDILGIMIDVFLNVESIRFIVMENVSVRKIITIIKVNVFLAQQTHRYQKMGGNVNAIQTIIGITIKIHVII